MAYGSLWRAMIGDEGEGFRYIMDGMNAERILIAAECVGDGRWFVEKATGRAGEREVFGRRIGENQGVQFPIARAYANVEAASLMVEKAASLFDRGSRAAPRRTWRSSWPPTPRGRRPTPPFRPSAATASTPSTTWSASSARRVSTRSPRSRRTSSSPTSPSTSSASRGPSDGAAPGGHNRRLAGAGGRRAFRHAPARRHGSAGHQGGAARRSETSPALTMPVEGLSSHFVWINRSKESIALDLKQEVARKVLNHLWKRRRLRPEPCPRRDGAARLGGSIARTPPPAHRVQRLGLRRLRPHGQEGLRPARPVRGRRLRTGTHETPSKAGIAVADIAAGMYAYSGILAALFRRERTGEARP